MKRAGEQTAKAVLTPVRPRCFPANNVAVSFSAATEQPKKSGEIRNGLFRRHLQPRFPRELACELYTSIPHFQKGRRESFSLSLLHRKRSKIEALRGARKAIPSIVRRDLAS